MKLAGLDGYMTQTQLSYWALIKLFSVQLKLKIHIYQNRTIWGLLMASTFIITLIVTWVQRSHRLLSKIRQVVEKGKVKAKVKAKERVKVKERVQAKERVKAKVKERVKVKEKVQAKERVKVKEKAKMIIDEGCKDHSISIYRVRRFT